MLLRARSVVPVAREPIENGGVWIDGNQIRAVGSWTALLAQYTGPQSAVKDLGDVIIHPGWVNAHCHLELTDLAGRIAPPRSFTSWVQALMGAKGGWSFSEYAASWLHGARQCLRAGITTVANIESTPEILSDVRNATPLRVWSLLELTGIRRNRSPEHLLMGAEEVLRSLPLGVGGIGLSPHAPYSTPPGLLTAAAALAISNNWPISTHIAESMDEFEMFLYHSGPLYHWIQPQRGQESAHLLRETPLAYCARQGLLSPNLIAVHLNALTDADIALLARSGATVVHCPQSHFYFQHPRFRYHELRAAGVRVCLGTDSLATTRRLGRKDLHLSMSDELRAFTLQHPGVAPGEVLRLGTLHGAAALGQSGRCGELSVGANADLVVLPFSGSIRDAESAIIEHSSEVWATWINGKLAWKSPEFQAHITS